MENLSLLKSGTNKKEETKPKEEEKKISKRLNLQNPYVTDIIQTQS